nr:hypothetical protein [Pseudarcicella sp.]
MPLITRTKKMYSINFRPRLNKAKNQSTIYIRLSINGKICSDIATPIKIAPDKWNVEKKTIKGIDKLSLVQNQELLSIKSEIIALILANPFFDVDEIKELYIGNKKKDMLVVEALEEYLTEKVFSAPESKKSKVLIYKYILKKIKHCIGNEEVYISEITQKKLDALYLKVLDGIGLNYAKLTINTLIRAIKYFSKKISVKIHDLSTSEYQKTPKKTKTFMLDADYILFKNEKTNTPKQEIAKDLALVMARTGVDYCDLQGIFEKAKENTKVISLPRTKTNVMASIPLL